METKKYPKIKNGCTIIGECTVEGRHYFVARAIKHGKFNGPEWSFFTDIFLLTDNAVEQWKIGRENLGNIGEQILAELTKEREKKC